jgi:hypothetical protein
MNPNEQVEVEEEDVQIKGPRNGVKMSFNNIVRKLCTQIIL